MIWIARNHAETANQNMALANTSHFRRYNSCHIIRLCTCNKTDLQHQRHLFHNFIDFKKAFNRVWHAGLRQVLRSFNIDEGLIQTIQALYENSSGAVLLNSQLGVCQGCLLSPILFNLFLEKNMQEAHHDQHTSISTGGRPMCNLLFANEIDLMWSSNSEFQDLTNRLID